MVRINSDDGKVKGFINFTDLFAEPDTSILPKNRGSKAAINIQYTSGTTGSPKPATLSSYNILNNSYAIGNRLFYTHEDNVAIPVPYYHCFGMILGTLAAVTRGAASTIVC